MAGETETSDTDFAERERQAAEDRAFELNPYGTGVDPDLNLGYDYDYEESPDLTDADYQPNNSFSDDFTNYGGADPYSNQFGQDDDDENEDDDNNGETQRYREEDYGDDTEDWDGDDEDEWNADDADDEDNENENESDNEEDNEDAQKDDVDDEKSKEASGPMTKEEKRKAKKKQKEKENRKKEKDAIQRSYYNKHLKVKWQKGDPVDLPTLNMVWGQCRKITSLRPMMDSVNEALNSALLATGPNLMIKFNKYIHSVMNQEDDLMGSLLDLANSGGKRLVFTTASIVEAVFDQGWLQPAMIATVPTILSGLIAAQPLQMLLQKLFEKAVPIINGMAKDQAKSTKVKGIDF